jgi:TolB protein
VLKKIVGLAGVLILVFKLNSYSQDSKESVITYNNAVWSADGKSIAFESTRDGKSAIYTCNADGSNLKRITDTIMNYGQPAWSPDSRSLVYYGGVHPMQLYIKSLDGGTQVKLSTTGEDAYEPSWSTGNKIAFSSRPDGEVQNDISVINADGKGKKKLTDGHFNYYNPGWSIDGNKIVFVKSIAVKKKWRDISDAEKNQMHDSAEIMVMNSDGSDIHALTNDSTEQFSPTWSADGKAIYFLGRKLQSVVVYRMRTGDNRKGALAILKGDIHNVSVSADNKRIVYAASRNNKHAVYLFDVRARTETKLIGD